MNKFGCLLLMGLVAFAAVGNAADCRKINTVVTGAIGPCAESPIGLCAPGSARSGLLKGGKTFVFLGVAPGAGLLGLEPPTVLSYTGPVVYTTDKGTLTLKATGVLDQVSLVFTEIQQVTGGTGDFAGATGTLFLSGSSTGTLPTGVTPFSSDVSGEVCPAN